MLSPVYAFLLAPLLRLPLRAAWVTPPHTHTRAATRSAQRHKVPVRVSEAPGAAPSLLCPRTPTPASPLGKTPLLCGDTGLEVTHVAGLWGCGSLASCCWP